MKRYEIFESILCKLTRRDIHQFVREAANIFPDYFFEIPSSITEKNHPLWALGPGGLVRHTIAVADYVLELKSTFELEPYQVDECVAAALLHDSLKYGFEFSMKHYNAYQIIHPVLVRGYFENLRSRLMLDQQVYKRIMHLVERHMGSYRSGKWSSTGLKPETVGDAALHLADYVVSRNTFIYEPFKDFHCDAENQPDVPWLETKDMWWRDKIERNKYYNNLKQGEKVDGEHK